jgi:hypothetical protein
MLGAHLNWHGALSFDYIFPADTQGPVYIDANPRLVEPMDAYLSGVDLAGTLVRVAMNEALGTVVMGAEGVRTPLDSFAVSSLFFAKMISARRRSRRWGSGAHEGTSKCP